NSAAFIRDNYPGIDVLEHARKLQAVSGGIIILTDGPHLVRVLDRDGSIISVQPPTVHALDATGAGDAFRAGLITGLFKELPLATAVQRGVAAGALKVQALSAVTHTSSWEEVSRLAATLEVAQTL